MGGRKPLQGFSLVETLIAVVVVVMGLLAITGTLGWVTRYNAKLRYQKIAAALADSELNALECKPALPKRTFTYLKAVGKPVSDLPADATLTVTSIPYPTENEPRLRYVRVAVKWGAESDPLRGRVTRERLICLR